MTSPLSRATAMSLVTAITPPSTDPAESTTHSGHCRAGTRRIRAAPYDSPQATPTFELPGGRPMPIATPEVYNEMLDRAKANEFAFPAINVTSSETINAALRGFAEAESDGIIQVSTGGAEFASGTKVKEMVTG